MRSVEAFHSTSRMSQPGTTDTYTINLAGNYSEIDRLNILSESLIILGGTGSFTFDADGDLETGDSALRIESGVTLNLER